MFISTVLSQMATQHEPSEDFPPDVSQAHIINTPHGIKLAPSQLDDAPPFPPPTPAPNPKLPGGSKSTIPAIRLVAVTGLFVLLLAYALRKEPIIDATQNSPAVTAVLLITTQNEAIILESIGSFSKDAGKYFTHIIVGCNQNISIETLSKINHVQWVFAKKNFDFSFLDQLVQRVQTQFFFYSTTQWSSKNNDFIPLFLPILSRRNDISEIFIDSALPLTAGYQERPVGFTLQPALHRLSDYLAIAGGYSAIAGSQCLLGEQCAKKISQFYFSKGLHTVATNFNQLFYSEEKQPLKNQGQRKQQHQKKDKEKQQPFADLNMAKIIKAEKNEYNFQQQPEQTQKKIPPGSSAPTINPQVLNIQKSLKEAPLIYQTQLLSEFQELPFCLLVMSWSSKEKQIKQSVKYQEYSNYRLIELQSREGENSYYTLRNQVRVGCIKNSIVMFLTSPLENGALHYLNNYYQKYRVFITYARTQTSLEVFSFFTRIYELLEANDFQKSVQPHLQDNNRQVQLLGMLQLCRDFTKLVERSKVFMESDEISYFSIARNSSKGYQYQPYIKILRLSQDMSVDVAPIENWRNSQMSKRRSPRSNLTETDMLEAIERQQEWYLPQNHSIQQLEFMEYNQKFGIAQYQGVDKQVPFCLTILSHNNIQNRRFAKAIESIVQQKYLNYHIVFIDDCSTDQNLQASRKYFDEVGFPRDRIKYIKNLKRNFATYNILNAAFNYCNEDDIQMLMDGDDEFIGKYAFQVINAAYQQDPELWVAYSNYKTSSYDFGRSIPFTSEFEHMSPDRKRLFVSSIGPIRTWRVKLLYSIPAKHHQMENGDWLDTVYDDALQHPLVELATVKRVKYINEILYEYNVKYGDNDDSTAQKINHRTSTFRYILTLRPLDPLTTLAQTAKDADVSTALKKDAGIKYV